MHLRCEHLQNRVKESDFNQNAIVDCVSRSTLNNQQEGKFWYLMKKSSLKGGLINPLGPITPTPLRTE